jgi:hypothetical protein
VAPDNQADKLELSFSRAEWTLLREGTLGFRRPIRELLIGAGLEGDHRRLRLGTHDLERLQRSLDKALNRVKASAQKRTLRELLKRLETAHAFQKFADANSTGRSPGLRNFRQILLATTGTPGQGNAFDDGLKHLMKNAFRTSSDKT